MARAFTLTADGGSRGNPGPAGYGAVVSEAGKIVAELYDHIGVATSNVAEYQGLIAGLIHINSLDPEATVEVQMDSKLVVEQMSGRWQIKHSNMRELAAQARAAHTPSLVKYSWIPRDLNSHADRLANKALDNESGGSETHAPVQINYLTDRLRSDEVPTTIYMIRHGETPMTPERRFSGSGTNDPGLSDHGLTQAAAVAKVIEEIKPDVLISSPMKRAQQTAQAIAQSTHLPIIEDEIWTELSFGHWDGLTNQEVREKFGDEYEAWLSSTAVAPKDGESHNSIAARVEAALSHLVDAYPGKKVVVVTHNMVIRHAVRITLGAPIDGVFHIDVTPTSVTSLSIWPSDGLRCLRMVGNDSHLN
jgi:ribonuclease H / adenosylcobalamin/alpha-ribazole phosphatase